MSAAKQESRNKPKLVQNLRMSASYKGFQSEAAWTGCHIFSMFSNPEIDRSNPVRRTYSPKLTLEAMKLTASNPPLTLALPVELAFLLLHRCLVAPRQTWHGWWCARSCCFLPSLGKHNVGKYQLALILYIVIWMDLIICCTWLQGTMGAHLRRNHPVLLHHHRG